MNQPTHVSGVKGRALAFAHRQRAPLTVGSAVILLFFSELLAERFLGKGNDVGVVFLATLTIALGMASGTAVLRRFVSNRWAIVGGLLVPAALAAHRAAQTVFYGSRLLIVATVIVAGMFSVVLAFMSGLRWVRYSIATLAAVALIGAGSHLVLSTTILHLKRGLGPSHDAILIVLDTTRRDHLSIYGYPKQTTPSLERLVGTSQLYMDAWSVSPWTPPSHASILTGLLPAEHGADGSPAPPLKTEIVTLQEVLQAAGYRTAGFVANPNLWVAGWNQGFDRFEGPVFTGSHTLVRLVNTVLFGESGNGWLTKKSTATLLRKARAWWESHDGESRFLFLNLLDPHRPYDPPPEYYKVFSNGPSMSEAKAVDEDPVTYFLTPGLSEHDKELLAALYDAEIASMDAELGKFFEWLSVRGQLDSTLLIVTADHGERLGERGLVGHDLVMDAYLLRVPLIIRLPGALQSEKIDRTVQLDGLPGFIADVLGIQVPKHMSDLSLGRQNRKYVVAQYQNPEWFIDRILARDPHADTEPYRGDWNLVSDGRFCLVASTNGSTSQRRLVDMATDTDWRNDVSNEFPGTTSTLVSISQELPRFEETPAQAVDESVAARLRALGYID